MRLFQALLYAVNSVANRSEFWLRRWIVGRLELFIESCGGQGGQVDLRHIQGAGTLGGKCFVEQDFGICSVLPMMQSLVVWKADPKLDPKTGKANTLSLDPMKLRETQPALADALGGRQIVSHSVANYGIHMIYTFVVNEPN